MLLCGWIVSVESTYGIQLCREKIESFWERYQLSELMHIQNLDKFSVYLACCQATPIGFVPDVSKDVNGCGWLK